MLNILFISIHLWQKPEFLVWPNLKLVFRNPILVEVVVVGVVGLERALKHDTESLQSEYII